VTSLERTITYRLWKRYDNILFNNIRKLKHIVEIFANLYTLFLLLFFFLLGLLFSRNLKAPSFQIGSGWNLAGLFLT